MLKKILLGMTLFVAVSPNHAMEAPLVHTQGLKTYTLHSIQQHKDLAILGELFADSFAKDYKMYLENIWKRWKKGDNLKPYEEKFLFDSGYAKTVNPNTGTADYEALTKILKDVFEEEELNDFDKKNNSSFYTVQNEKKEICAYFSVEELANGLYIRQFFVPQDYKRQGIGKSVLRDILPTLHKGPLYAATRYINEGALALWKNSGFIETQELSHSEQEWIHDLPKHSYVMLKMDVEK